jgi:hypothetical protein
VRAAYSQSHNTVNDIELSTTNEASSYGICICVSAAVPLKEIPTTRL